MHARYLAAFAVIGGVVLLALPVRAAPDLTGRWTVQLTDFMETLCLDFVQTGTAVSAFNCGSTSDPYSGTIDLGTGVFLVQRAVPCGQMGIGGTVAPDGLSFTGSGGGDLEVCVPLPPGCTCLYSTYSSAVGARVLCGNGALDGGEQCDDGNYAAGDCCSPTCQFESPGAPCAGDLDPCTADACDGAGACVHPITPGAVCRPSTDPCDPAELCTGGGACPPDGALPDGASCDDADHCTAGETCGGGICGGGTVVCVDPLKCYRARDRRDPAFAFTTLALADQFGNGVATVKKPHLLCNPVDLNGGGLISPAGHYTCYKVAADDAPAGTGVQAQNLFGSTDLAISRAHLLCVPSAKTLLP